MDQNNEMLITKYHPLFFNDFVTESKERYTVNSLLQINNGNILFMGDNGVGKTTYINATIREYLYNVEPKLNIDNIENDIKTIYKDNILVINPLKSQGIEYFRTTVKNFCKTLSTIPNKKKIIVLDDLDMMPEACQQIFRSYINNYSNKIYFIGSYTHQQRVIDQLRSSLFTIKINKLTKHDLKTLLEHIVKNENLKINDNTKQYLLDYSNYNIKILINYLEKIKLYCHGLNENNNDVDDNIDAICSLLCHKSLEQFTLYLKNNQLAMAMEYILKEMKEIGYSLLDVLDNYFEFIKITNIIDDEIKYEITQIIQKYTNIFYNVHDNEIELLLFTYELLGAFHTPNMQVNL